MFGGAETCTCHAEGKKAPGVRARLRQRTPAGNLTQDGVIFAKLAQAVTVPAKISKGDVGKRDVGQIVAEGRAAQLRHDLFLDRKSTRLNSSHIPLSRMPSSA